MANNKVQLANGTVLIDITDTTANASDVLSGEYFYNASGVKTEGSLTIPSTYTVTKTLTNVTTNSNDTEVLSGGSFYMDLTPSAGMVINSITVTMGGVDVTEQVFKAGVGEKIITQNGVYDAEDDWLEGYSSVNVNVQNSYTSSDEGKVVNNGSLVSQTSATYTTNNTYDTTLINSVTVNVSGGITPTGTKQISISSNGTTTEDVTNYANAEISIAVPNSYSASDEGKVVSSGALVSQTSDTVTTNGTVDTTLINSLTVSVPTGGSSKLVQGSFTTNSSAGAQSVSINYSGSGYPIAACVYIDGGMRSNSTFNSLVKRYAIGQATLVKAYTSTAPTYSTSGDENVGILSYVYKNSTSDASTYGASANTTANSYSSSDSTSTAATTLRFKSKNSMSVYVKGSSGYGFAASTTYHYDIIYSA